MYRNTLLKIMEILNRSITQSRQTYFWSYEFNNFHETLIEIEKAFTDYNECRPHSSIDFLPPREFRRKFLNYSAFRNIFEKKEAEATIHEN